MSDGRHILSSMRLEDMKWTRGFRISSLVHEGLQTLRDVDGLTNRQLLRIPNFGQKGVAEVRQAIKTALDRHPVAIETYDSNASIIAAIDTIQQHLKSDWIADACRDARFLGCVSCQMLRLSEDLAMLRHEVADIRSSESITPPNNPPGHEPPPSV